MDGYKLKVVEKKEVLIGELKSEEVGVRRVDEGGLDEKWGMKFGE